MVLQSADRRNLLQACDTHASESIAWAPCGSGGRFGGALGGAGVRWRWCLGPQKNSRRGRYK